MKNRITYFSFLLTLLIIQVLNLQAQITRGATPGELYLSTDWYMDNYGHIHYGIFRSDDNGATITLQYESSTASPSSEMVVGKVLGDATPGALYNYYGELWVSFDYGESWELVDDIGSTPGYTSGCIEGEIYKCCANVEGTVWRSIDYGNEFVEIRDDIKFKLEVGINEGIVFGLANYSYPEMGFYLNFSNDYSLNFTQIPIDSTIAYWVPSGQYPQISRGTESGEIYLFSWWLEPNYKIFHSVDTGYTWTEKFESDYIDLYFWRVHYTAGREPGSFYVMRSRINPPGDHIWLYIDYSNDYGETFTTYFHDLDSTITSINYPESNNFSLSNYPNPFDEHTTFSFQIDESNKNPELNIFDIYGNLIKQISISEKKTQVWDGTDKVGNKVREGIYLYNISLDKYTSELNKLLIIH
jgi:gliding motility-associated-like protein